MCQLYLELIRVAAPLAMDSTEISRVLLSVSDTGTGMNDEVRSRLFEPLFTTKAQQRGTGLGLANVYDIVQQYQGTIEVATELGAGSCFRIALPRCRTLEASPAPVRFLSEVRSLAGATHGKTILVVDDDDCVRRTVARTLELGGFRVLCASNVNAALQISAEHEDASLVVADMHMPGCTARSSRERCSRATPSSSCSFFRGHAG